MKRYSKLFKLLLVIISVMLGFVNPVFSDDVTGSGSQQSINGTAGVSGTQQEPDVYMTTVIPATVSVGITGSGSVWNSGNAYGNQDTFRTTDMNFKLVPGDGYETGDVYWNSNDVTNRVKNGALSFPDLENGTLNVAFNEIPIEEDEDEDEDEIEDEKEEEEKEEEKTEPEKTIEPKSEVVEKSKKQAKFPRTADDDYKAVYYVLAVLACVVLFVWTLKGKKIRYFIG